MFSTHTKMSISILNTENAKNPDKKTKLNLMPCKIHTSEPAQIDKYFKPTIKNDPEGCI